MPDAEHLRQLRAAMLSRTLQCDHSLIGKPSGGSETYALNSAFRAIPEILAMLSAIGEVDHDFEMRVCSLLDRKAKESSIKQAFHASHDLLLALWEFLQDPPQVSFPGGFFAYSQITEYLRGSHEMFQKITPKLLSQELNKWPDLVADRKRIPVIGSVPTKSVTCAVFDVTVLQHYLN
jgi:hypothetical protein